MRSRLGICVCAATLALSGDALHACRARVAFRRRPTTVARRSEPNDWDSFGSFDETPSWEDDATPSWEAEAEDAEADEDALAAAAIDALAAADELLPPPPDDDESEEPSFEPDAGALDTLAAEPVAAPSEDDDRLEASESALDLLEAEEREQLEDAGVYADERIGEVASHELIDVDEDGDPIVSKDKMVFVDEATCIGCTMCATIAPLTFLMEDDFGRARSFNQEGDTDEVVEEAISTCPVDCIHYVPWDELVKLERERDAEHYGYNYKGRLVGNEGIGLSAAGAGANLLDISTNNMMRCNNCPTNKCPECPMYSVSEGPRSKRCGNCPTNGCINCPIATQYPEFQKKRARRDRKRRERRKAEQEEIREQLGVDAPGREVDL